MRIIGAQHHRTVGTQLIDAIERRLTRIPASRQVSEELPGDGERIISPALLARHAEDLGLAGRDGIQDLPGQEGLADAWRAFNDNTYPGRRPPLDHCEYQVVYGPRHRSTIGWR
jgi:hypothetical protein